MANKCPECGGLLKETYDEIYCTICGLVIEDEIIDVGKEDSNPDNIKAPTISNLNPEIGSYFNPKERNSNRYDN